jgi:hypothetical protein
MHEGYGFREGLRESLHKLKGPNVSEEERFLVDISWASRQGQAAKEYSKALLFSRCLACDVRKKANHQDGTNSPVQSFQILLA